MEITYRRTVQVQEFESITIEAKHTYEPTPKRKFSDQMAKLEKAVDNEIEAHRKRLWAKIQLEDADGGIDYEEEKHS